MTERRLPRSLARRIVTTTAIVTALGMIALVVLEAIILSGLVTDSVSRSLQDRASAVAAIVEPNGRSIRMRETTTDLLETETWIYDAAGHLVEGGKAPALVQAVITSLAGATTPVALERENWALRAVPVTFEGTPGPSGVVVVAASLAPYRSTEAVAIALSAALGALVVAGVALVARWTVARSLAPVATMALRAEQWSETDLTRRFALGRPHDEITRLGGVLDSLLDRVSQAILAEQRLSAELAHELRTPLTVIRAEAELAAETPGLAPDAATRLDRIVRAVDGMTEVIQTLLSLARGATPPLEASDAGTVLRRAAEADAAVVKVIPSPPLRLAVPEAFAVRALAPLVQNAIEHRRSRVWLEAHAVPGAVELLVRDDGPGLEEVPTGDLFRPGVRGAASSGAGLGLPLARRLARAAGGEVEFRGAEPTTFVLRLPAAPHADAGATGRAVSGEARHPGSS